MEKPPEAGGADASAAASGVDSFLRERKITAELEHPAIVPVYDSGVSPQGEPYYVMRIARGEPLDRLIQRAGSLEASTSRPDGGVRTTHPTAWETAWRSHPTTAREGHFTRREGHPTRREANASTRDEGHAARKANRSRWGEDSVTRLARPCARERHPGARLANQSRFGDEPAPTLANDPQRECAHCSTMANSRTCEANIPPLCSAPHAEEGE
jgi:hypothetical protein